MADKSYTPLSSFTLAEVKSLCSVDSVFNKLTDAQQTLAINFATKKLGNLLNRNGSNDYRFNANSDADLVLAPASAGNAYNYDQNGQLKFGAYEADIADNAIAFTSASVGLTLASKELSLVTNPGLVTYTITIDEAVLDAHTEIHPNMPNGPEITITDTTEFTVVAGLNHPAFSIFIKNAKES